MSAYAYRQYLAITAIERRVERAGGKLDQHIILSPPATFWRERAEAALPDGTRQELMEWCEVHARLALGGTSDADREQIGDRLQALYPDFVPFRSAISKALYFEPLHNIGVRLDLRVI